MRDYVKEAQERYGAAGDTIWEEIPVSYEEFYNKDTGYIREPFFPIQAQFAKAMLGLAPKEWSTEYDEGHAYWGKGSGKDRTAAKILVYVCYKLMCMRNPMQTLSAGAVEIPTVEDKLEVGNVCINAKLAEKVFFKYFTILLRACRNPKTKKNWFVEHGLDLRRDVHKRDVEFPKNITAHSLDSEKYTGEGLNLLFVIFDEIAGFDVNAAEDLYKALVSTARSRFPKFMKILLLSYKRSDGDFMNIRYEASENNPRVYRSKASTWEVNLKRTKDDFIEDYLSDHETAERTYECQGRTSQKDAFIRQTNRISQVINNSGIDNPVVGDIISTVNLRSLQFKESFKPRPQTPYYVHVDLAKGREGGDACGISMGHFEQGMTINLSDDFIKALSEETGFSEKKFKEQVGRERVGVVIDLAIQIKAPKGGEILFEEVRNFIETLRRVHKFPVHWVTYDGWQSTDSIQLLRKSGVNAEEYSVDRTPEAYTTLKNLIYEGVFRFYNHRIAIREMEELIIVDSGKKTGSVLKFRVDHPEKSAQRRKHEDKSDKGSKDVADAIAGVVHLCIKYGKSAFKFWAGDLPSVVESPENVPQKTPSQVQRWESEHLVRYGEKPPDYYRRKPK